MFTVDSDAMVPAELADCLTEQDRDAAADALANYWAGMVNTMTDKSARPNCGACFGNGYVHTH